MSPAKKEYIIVSVVCNEYKISVDDLTNPKSKPKQPGPFDEAKMAAMHLVQKNTFSTMGRIGPLFGYSVGFTAAFVKNWIEAKQYNDETFKRRLAKLEAILPEIFKIHK